MLRHAAPCCAYAATPDTGKQVVVASDVAQFQIPIPNQSSWQWNLSGDEDNIMEYEWVAKVENAGKVYEVGFSLFKLPHAAPTRGTINDLLSAGQLDIWMLNSDGGSTTDLGKLSVSLGADNSILVTVTGESTVNTLFSSKPKTVVFYTMSPGNVEALTIVQVQYSRAMMEKRRVIAFRIQKQKHRISAKKFGLYPL